MTEDLSRTHSARQHRAPATGINAQSTLPRSSAALVTSNQVNQASVPLPEDGGASASAPDLCTAFSSDPVLTGLQGHLAAMSSHGFDTPRDFFVPSSDPFPDYTAYETYPLDALQGDSQYTLTSSLSSVNPRYLESHPGDVDGISTRQPGPDPWSHVTVNKPTSMFPNNVNPAHPGVSPVHLTTPAQGRHIISGNGLRTFADSAYATGSRRSHRPSSTESLGKQHSGYVDLRRMNSTPTPARPSDTPSQSSTVTPTAQDPNQPPARDRASSARRSQRRQSDLECPECQYAARTRSDLKKHSARHKREYKCHFQNCQQSKKGFATVNDRDRHLRSVHKVKSGNSKSFKCFGEGCSKADKDWPRLDNFKQHLRKMHPEHSTEDLLRMSNEWFEQQAPPDPIEEDDSASFPMSLQEQFASFRNPCPPSTASYISSTSKGSDLASSISQAPSVVNPSFVGGNVDPHLLQTHQSQRRSFSGSSMPGNLQRPSAEMLLTPRNPAFLSSSMQRARSQTNQPSHPDLSQLPADVTSQRVGMHFMQAPSYDPMLDFSQLRYASPQVFELDQARRVPKACTVAGPDLHLHRAKDFPALREPQVIPKELRDNQEDLAGFGNNPQTLHVPTPSVRPARAAGVTKLPEDSQNSGFQKRLLDEINSFLAEHESKAGNQPLSEEEVMRHLRLSLQGGGEALTSCGASSVGPLSSRPEGKKTSEGIRCPVMKQTYFVCPVCKKSKKRKSELNKHLQRHSKPYGCVFDKCQKTFGSKNDWKRHEQTQHEQQECWHCHVCYEVFFHHQSHYMQHMSEVHSTQRLEESAGQNRIAQNYQGRFWCGFCRKIISHSKTDIDAINLRFDHIADHFMRDGKASRDWIELTGRGKTKQQIHDEEQSQTTTEAEGDEAPGDSQDIIASTQSPASPPSEDSPTQHGLSTNSEDFDAMQDTVFDMGELQGVISPGSHAAALMSGMAPDRSGRLGSQARHSRHQHGRHSFNFCCQCGEYSNTKLSSRVCLDCSHAFCSACKVEVAQNTQE